MNILIVEDEAMIAESIRRIFAPLNEVNVVHTADSFDEAYKKSLSGIYDVILIDILLNSKMNGIDLCESIRKNDMNTVLIMITALSSLKYLEQAFQAGANDYITKPFNRKEIEIRVKRWQRFLVTKLFHEDQITYQNLSYDCKKNIFYFNSEELDLSRKNKSLLLLFLKNAESVLSQDFIQEKLWGDYDTLYKKRNVRSAIQLLKKSLEGTCDIWVQTVRGEGYTLRKD